MVEELTDLVEAVNVLPAILGSIALFSVAPQLLMELLLLYPKGHERRAEHRGELCAVPRWQAVLGCRDRYGDRVRGRPASGEETSVVDGDPTARVRRRGFIVTCMFCRSVSRWRRCVDPGGSLTWQALAVVSLMGVGGIRLLGWTTQRRIHLRARL